MPFSFSMPRGSSALFAVILRNKKGTAINVSGALEAWLVVADAVETPTGSLDLKLALSLGTQTGYVFRTIKDSESVGLAEKTFVGQVKVKLAIDETLVLPDDPFDFKITEPVEDVP